MDLRNTLTSIRERLRIFPRSPTTPPTPTTAPESPIQAIERITQRRVVISRTLSPKVLAHSCNPQDASPLYTDIPKEIRDLIFALATTPTPDLAHAYKNTDYWYRPDHTAPLHTRTALLLTCRRVWLETHALPLQQAENAFWFQRGPHDQHPDVEFRQNINAERQRYKLWLERLTDQGLREVRQVRFFMQMYPLQDFVDHEHMRWFFPMGFVEKGFRPRMLQITIRHSDWTNWEHGQKLDLQDRYVQYVLDAPELGGIEQFRLELETLESKKDELEEIVQRLLPLRGKTRLAEPTKADCQTASMFICNTIPTVETWTGPTNINGADLHIFHGLDRLVYRSRTITWMNAHFPITEQGEEKLAKYPILHPVPTFRPQTDFPRIRRLVARPPVRLPMGSSGPRYRSSSIPTMFVQQQERLWNQAVQQAGKSEGAMRALFEKVFGDEEAKKWETRWEREGSLLEFEA